MLSSSLRLYNLRVASCELRVVSCNCKEINLQVASSLLRVANSNFWVANLFCEFEIKLRVASCFLQVTNLRTKIYELQVVFCELKIQKFYFTRRQLLFRSWKFKINHQEQIPVHFCYLGIIHIKGQPENI